MVTESVLNLVEIIRSKNSCINSFALRAHKCILIDVRHWTRTIHSPWYRQTCNCFGIHNDKMLHVAIPFVRILSKLYSFWYELSIHTIFHNFELNFLMVFHFIVVYASNNFKHFKWKLTYIASTSALRCVTNEDESSCIFFHQLISAAIFFHYNKPNYFFYSVCKLDVENGIITFYEYLNSYTVFPSQKEKQTNHHIVSGYKIAN